MRPDLLIRDARRAAGLTQAQLAERLRISQSAIAKLEREGSNPTVETLDRVLRPTGHRLQLIAPAWGSAAGTPGPSIDVDLVARHLQLTPGQRIAGLEQMHAEARKIDRWMLGHAGAVKLWPPGPQLVVGEGIETVLAAATRIPYRGAPLQPAWAVLSASALKHLPVLPGVERLILLVDHDRAGIDAAASYANRWQRARRTIVRLTPKLAGTDFNDLVMPEAVA